MAPSRPFFGYESLVSALQSGTRLESSALVESSTLSAHQISIRGLFGGIPRAELSNALFWLGGDLFGWYWPGSEIIFVSAFEVLSRGGRLLVRRAMDLKD